MTLDEMKLAVCEKLPDPALFHKARWEELFWPTEGLQVCHEAEKLLTAAQYCLYEIELADKTTPVTTIQRQRSKMSATYEQRLESLCRVWWPERFV